MHRPHRDWIPVSWNIAWLCLLGWLIWRHVSVSDQPLIGDGRGYWLKARTFWNLAANGAWFNPFNIEPTVRPPGTILMSYPFGFSESIKGFLFRSVFFPISLSLLGVQVAGRLTKQSAGRGIDLACIAAFVCSAPLFYHFEYVPDRPSPAYWGMVDNFIGGTAALTVALALYASLRSSKSAALGAGLLASLCFCTKPTGLIVVLLAGLVWIVVAAVFAARSSSHVDPRAPDLRSLIIGLSIYCVVAAPFIIVGRFFSQYFSAENISYGDRVVGFLRDAWPLPAFGTSLHNVQMTLGPLVTLSIVVTLVFGVLRSRTIRAGQVSLARGIVAIGTVCGLLFILSGIWFWLIYTGGSQVRYFYPFIMPGLVALVPVALELMSEAGPNAKVILRALLVLPAVNLTMLLATLHPSPTWQTMTGVNVGMTDVTDDMSISKALLRSVRERGRDVVLYEDMSGRGGIMDRYWGFEISANPSLPNVHVVNPIDYVRTSTFRVREVADADFLLFRTLRASELISQRLSTDASTDFESEERIFQAWASSLNSADGVRIFAETDDLRLLQIVDHSKLEQSLANLVVAHKWRSVFTNANPQTWWPEKEILERPNLILGHDGPVRFGDKFEVRAVASTLESDQITVEFWWRRIANAEMSDNWYFFVHELDGAGVTVAHRNVRLREFVGGNPSSEYMIQSLIVPISSHEVPKDLAVGIFQLVGGKAESLAADSGNRDWGNHRVIIHVAPSSR
jgi:hypothetical protein